MAAHLTLCPARPTPRSATEDAAMRADGTPSALPLLEVSETCARAADELAASVEGAARLVDHMRAASPAGHPGDVDHLARQARRVLGAVASGLGEMHVALDGLAHDTDGGA